MKLTSPKSIYWILIATFLLGTIAVVIINRCIYVSPLDSQDNMISMVFPLLGTMVIQFVVFIIIFKGKLSFNKPNKYLTFGMLISLIVSAMSYAIFALYLQGVDHSTVKTYQYAQDYNPADQEKVIRLKPLPLNIYGLCSREFRTTTRASRKSRALGAQDRHYTTTHYAMPIVASPNDPTITGWLFSSLPSSEFQDIIENERFAELIDFSGEQEFLPLDLTKDEKASQIVSRSQSYDAQAASKPAFYACNEMPMNRSTFIWYTLASYILTVIALRWSAKIISKIE